MDNICKSILKSMGTLMIAPEIIERQSEEEKSFFASRFIILPKKTKILNRRVLNKKKEKKIRRTSAKEYVDLKLRKEYEMS